MTFVPFRLCVQLATPACLHSDLTLDGILAAAHYRMHGDIDAAGEQLPLKRTDGIWHAGVIQFGAGVHSGQPYVARLTQRDLHPSGYADQRNRKGRVVVNVGGGVFSPQLRTLRTFLGEVAFDGCGDPAIVEAMFDALPGMGKNVNQGLGRISSFEVSMVEVDRSLVRENGTPGRPVPLQTWAQWGHDTDAVAQDMAGFNPPYWKRDRHVVCAMPT